MKRFLRAYLFLFLFATSFSYAQGTLESPAVNAGLGISGWGVPLYVGVDFPVHEAITVGGNLSYQSKKESQSYFGYTLEWKHTIIGISGRGDYHFNELLDLSEEWDLYGGLSLGYWFWNTKYTGDFEAEYSGSGSGGLGIYFQAGARYFFSDNVAMNLEVGGGNILSGGRIGVTFLLQ